jgi:hypothetical protein
MRSGSIEHGSCTVSETLTAKYDPKWLSVYSLVGLALAVVGIVGPSLHERIWSWVFLIGGAYVALDNALRVCDRRIVLVIDDDGLFDRRIVDRKIPWKEIQSTATSRYRGSSRRVLVLKVVHPERFISNPYKHFLRYLQPPYSRLLVSEATLDARFDAINKAVDHRLNKR